MTHGWFYKGGSVDVSYLSINDVLEYNPPYLKSDFTCNLGPMLFYVLFEQPIRITGISKV